jgi:predicted dehydrogenase
VTFEAAAFTPVAAVGLQGIRLAEPTLGETVVVYGLGLIGLLTVQLLRANGCRVLGIDTNPARLALAQQFGADTVLGGDGDVAARVRDVTDGVGADAVLLTLASPSDDPVHQAALMSRKRGRIVLVGVTGLHIRRDDFYSKELQFRVSCSYGPGRYDPEYEDGGRDYPLSHVRWTAQRNFEAVLQLMAAGAVDPLPLLTHRFPFKESRRAYDLITSPEPSLGILLEYEGCGQAVRSGKERTIDVHLRPGSSSSASFCVGVIGAGNFGSRVLIPALVASGARLRTIASGRGTSAAVAARRFGFERVTTDLEQVFSHDAVDTVIILTRHDSHAPLVIRALEAGKHVFVEKPLALSESDLDLIERTRAAAGSLLTVGFNRRFAPLAQALRGSLTGRTGPAALILTVNPGSIPRDHWTRDPQIGGGRIVGEACHFLDLARFLVGAPIRDVDVTTARGRDGRTEEDIAHLLMRFEDGSTAVVHYLANGSSAFPKERVEAFADGRVWQVDNWRRLKAFGGPGGRGHWFSRMEKGHREEVASFAQSVRTAGPPPIPYDELFEVSRWAIRAAERAMGVSRPA